MSKLLWERVNRVNWWKGNKEGKHEVESTNLNLLWGLVSWLWSNMGGYFQSMTGQKIRKTPSYIRIWIPLIPTMRCMGKTFFFSLLLLFDPPPKSRTKYRANKAKPKASAMSSTMQPFKMKISLQLHKQHWPLEMKISAPAMSHRIPPDKAASSTNTLGKLLFCDADTMFSQNSCSGSWKEDWLLFCFVLFFFPTKLLPWAAIGHLLILILFKRCQDTVQVLFSNKERKNNTRPCQVPFIQWGERPHPPLQLQPQSAQTHAHRRLMPH